MTSVSVVIPALNEAANIAATLQALPTVLETIVVDGGSTDGTAEAASAAGARVVRSGRGRARQMNAGAAVAQGDIILFLHADTRLPEYGIACVAALPDSELEWGRFDVTLDGGHFLFRVIETFMNARSRLTSIATGDQGIFVNRQTFESIGGFSDIPLMEDIDLSKRLRSVSRPLNVSCRVVTSARRWRDHGILRTILLMWRLRLLYFLGVSPNRLAEAYR